jgi:hypothetical protein
MGKTGILQGKWCPRSRKMGHFEFCFKKGAIYRLFQPAKQQACTGCGF